MEIHHHNARFYSITRANFAFPKATKSRQYVVALASPMVVLTPLIFQPLAAALLEVRQTWWSLPSMDLTQMKQVGLNQNQEFGDLSGLFCSSLQQASPLLLLCIKIFRLPFIHNEYPVAPFQLPSTDTSQGGIEANGTISFANSANSIDSNGCVLNWTVTRESEFLFGTNTTLCSGSDTPTQFAPIAFWFFSYNPTPRASATVRFNDALGMFYLKLDASRWNWHRRIQSFSKNSNLSALIRTSSASGNITGVPLNGRAYNGISFNLTTPVDPFVEARRSAIQLQLPASVFQLAREKPGGLETSFDLNVFVQLSTQVYVTYLTLLASTVYFVSPPSQEINTVQAKTVMNRVFLSSTAVHLLTVALLLLAFFCTLIQLFHRWDRRALNLPRAFESGTIASAVSVGAQTGMGELLAEVREKTRYRDEDVIKVLGQKKFRIDPDTMKIVMEGEEGYEWARSPNRRSAFFPSGEGGVGARLSRRLSAWGGVNGDGERSKSPLSAIPASPKTPKSPQAQRTGGGEV
ncbi:hypothetical protein VKT23_012740 [Stygiomarasmius scandens]|uniref:Uncharacterized protein n=1 Tax=Marasmiellus scandens TaxID=2682957 RepID=A0ABR1J567_9AGAR